MSSHSAAKKTDDEAGLSAPAIGTEKKDLYEVGEIPPLGHVPKNMYAWAIREERHGEPDTAMQVEVLPTWDLDSHEVLVLVMAAGVNYNGVWASLGTPISPIRDVHKNPFHITDHNTVDRLTIDIDHFRDITIINIGPDKPVFILSFIYVRISDHRCREIIVVSRGTIISRHL